MYCVFRYTIFKDHVTLEDCILYLPSVYSIACATHIKDLYVLTW